MNLVYDLFGVRLDLRGLIMQRVTLQITFWMMVLLDSSLVFGRPMSEKRSSDSVHAKTAETPRYLEVQYDDYPVRM